MSKTLVLASASPRRKALLDQIGVEFRVHPVDLDESMIPGEEALVHVQRLATEKARLGFEQLTRQETGLAVLAADTVVEIDGKVLGKPSGDRQAAAFLSRLSGKAHKVHTAIALVTNDQELAAVSSSDVEFMPLSEKQIAAYVATGEPQDKAGAYAIQHPGFAPVRAIDGCITGVMGLPLGDLCSSLAEFGYRAECAVAEVCERQARFACCQRTDDAVGG